MTRRGDLNGWWRFGIGIVSLIFLPLFRVRHVGGRRVPATGPAVLASNHVSAIDGVALALTTARGARRMVRFLVAAEFFRGRFGRVLRLYKQIPLRRGTGDVGALDDAIASVRAGAVAGIFPEGKVNPEPEGDLQRGRSGVARIALAARAPVVPVGIWGTQIRWPHAGLRWVRPWRPTIVVVYGEPVEPVGDPDVPEDVQAFVEIVMSAIATTVAEARAGAEGVRSR